mmetsp:Transcript_62784/g.149813  ORF Transcript_62784/g.149813 Transcript_62784/m.149813 type:complete len:133 (+) Transcript_62784:367-765(+)
MNQHRICSPKASDMYVRPSSEPSAWRNRSILAQGHADQQATAYESADCSTSLPAGAAAEPAAAAGSGGGASSSAVMAGELTAMQMKELDRRKNQIQRSRDCSKRQMRRQEKDQTSRLEEQKSALAEQNRHSG